MNAVNLRAWACKELSEPQLNFCQTVADEMINNRLDNSVNVIKQVPMPTLQKRGKGDGHILITWPHYCENWDLLKKNFSKTKKKYQKVHCNACNFKFRTYCNCDKATTLCSNCFTDHNPKVWWHIFCRNSLVIEKMSFLAVIFLSWLVFYTIAFLC